MPALTQSSTRLAPPDFDELEAAVMETEQGRWFLAQLTQRNRVADTTLLLDAIAKLEKNIGTGGTGGHSSDEAASIRVAICDMADEIEQAKGEIAKLAPGGTENAKMTGASAELDAIVESTETATSSILEAAEAVQELAWTLREEGVPDACCDALDQHATDIYTACSFQDITGQRITKVIGVLRMLDTRITTMAQLWGGSDAAGNNHQESADQDSNLLNGPALAGDAVDQDEVDRMMLGDALTAEAAFSSIKDPQETPAANPNGEGAATEDEINTQVAQALAEIDNDPASQDAQHHETAKADAAPEMMDNTDAAVEDEAGAESQSAADAATNQLVGDQLVGDQLVGDQPNEDHAVDAQQGDELASQGEPSEVSQDNGVVEFSASAEAEELPTPTASSEPQASEKQDNEQDDEAELSQKDFDALFA
ncbi:MAG: protein phosphatase CheZ [Alphaproteobacteria bacterium]